MPLPLPFLLPDAEYWKVQALPRLESSNIHVNPSQVLGSSHHRHVSSEPPTACGRSSWWLYHTFTGVEQPWGSILRWWPSFTRQPSREKFFGLLRVEQLTNGTIVILVAARSRSHRREPGRGIAVLTQRT